jgi:hypothetical protein
LAKRLSAVEPVHPRLHFNSEGSVRLRRQASGTHRRYAQLLFNWVERHREWSPPKTLPEGSGNEVILEESGAFVTNFALAYVISGDNEHIELARRGALAMCELPRGELPNYGLGIYAAGLARAYHWLPDDTYVYLNDSFRSGRYNTSGSASCHLLRRRA